MVAVDLGGDVGTATVAALPFEREKEERESERVRERERRGRVALLIPCSAAAWAQPRRTNATWPRAVAGRHCNRELQFEIS